jgi:hypothetical protein
MTDDEILLLARQSGITFAFDSEGEWDGLTDEAISDRYTGKPHPEDEYTIKRTVEILKPFARAVAAKEREACAKIVDAFIEKKKHMQSKG